MALAAVLGRLGFGKDKVGVWRDGILLPLVALGVIYAHTPVVLWLESGAWAAGWVVKGVVAAMGSWVLSLLSPAWGGLLASGFGFMALRAFLVALFTGNAVAGVIGAADLAIAALLTKLVAVPAGWDDRPSPFSPPGRGADSVVSKWSAGVALGCFVVFGVQGALIGVGVFDRFHPGFMPPLALGAVLAAAILSWMRGSQTALAWGVAGVLGWILVLAALARAG